MATARIVNKNLGVGPESSWGVSLAITQYMHVKSAEFVRNVNKTLLDDTACSSPLGKQRAVTQNEEVTGNINAYLTPTNAKAAFEWITGTSVGGVSLGNSAMSYTWTQAQVSHRSKWVRLEWDDIAQEDYYGLRANTLELTSTSGGPAEMTLDLIGQGYRAGVSMTTTASTLKPLMLRNFKVYYTTAGPSDLGISQTELLVDEFTLNVDNKLEGKHQSGSAVISRTDVSGYPEVKLTLKRVNEATNARDAAWGISVWSIRLEGYTTADQGLIAGATPYLVRIDLPAAHVVETPKRDYSAGELSMEEINFECEYNTVKSALWIPQMISDVA